MLPMGLFKLRAFATANPANALVFASLYATMFFLAQYFQTVSGEGPLGAGLRLMPWTGTLMVCAPIAGRMVDKVGERKFVVAGLFLQGVSNLPPRPRHSRHRRARCPRARVPSDYQPAAAPVVTGSVEEDVST